MIDSGSRDSFPDIKSGDKHSNHGRTVEQMILHMVALIRRGYSWDVPIVIRMDSGFFDQKIFTLCEKPQIGYICGGKMYEDIKQMAAGWDDGGKDRLPRRTDCPQGHPGLL